ncbi:type VI secretion system ImpA family N-terminal domain-containing protein [Pantoea sp. BAV 3049]|uniref:type VI secretion system ImpA family N-terminal domain-containing protein n=1 Tax=Pantoea sp. BAV 3049 TaxID=2654188 RepID=UPI00131C8CAD|nr:type VI secretion system ImpA family N-terminal domain-containing protein [Pantoea sp. BAV 3049]
MNKPTQNILHTGGDPRALPEFIALRVETGKLSQTGRGDIDWLRVEQLCISLFRLNGMDLQSVAWYTLARAWRAGLAGLCEGLEIATAMMKYQWATLWPNPLPARLAIITWLSTGLQHVLLSLKLTSDDLPLLQRLETQLDQNIETLEKLAQKHLSQLDRLKVQVSSVVNRVQIPQQSATLAISQSESGEANGGQIPSNRYGQDFTPLIYVPRDLTSSALSVSFSFWERSRAFFAGMLVMALFGSMTLWGYELMQPEPGKAQQIAMLAQQITPEQGKHDENWKEAMVATALPPEQMQLWQTAQFRLQRLNAELDSPEFQRTQVMSVPELKARLITIQQPLNDLVPLEELLRQLEKNPYSLVLRGKIEHRIKQDLARYSLILQLDDEEE